MQLPAGVTYRPRNARLIARNTTDEALPAVIQIRAGSAENNGYFRDEGDDDYLTRVAPYLKGDWEDFDRIFQFARTRKASDQKESASFFGAATRKLEIVPTLPDIHVITNFPTVKGRAPQESLAVFGCSMGELHPQFDRDPQVERLLEFQSFGAVTIDRGDGAVELWVAKDGDKVPIWSGSHATIYNLDDADNPLIYLSITREPGKESLERETEVDVRALARERGPILLAWYDEREASIVLNRLHVNTQDRIGVRISGDVRERRDREIRIRRGARLSLGQLLYEELTANPDTISRLARLGMRVRRPTPEIMLPQTRSSPNTIHFARSLCDAFGNGSDVETYFRQSPPAREPRPSKTLPPEHIEQTREPRKKPAQLKRPLTIVVEGAGEWVVEAYRDLFWRKVNKEKRAISVFYADDIRWKAARPDWANPKFTPQPKEWDPKKSFLQKWETYLDKSESSQFAQYLNLRPDAVFIVTPDFMHSTLARHWVGKAPLVFIEKPFDSQIAKVDELRRDMAGDNRTQVFGLDHYQFYAAPVPEMREQIRKHLDGALAEVTFFLTESKRIEKGRVRTLQHGLTLDLLPHMIALLTYFGDIMTIDEIRVLESGRYQPFEDDHDNDLNATFHSEAYSKIRFTMLDDSGNGYRVPCYAVVGKGFRRDVKYMDVRGQNGNRVRIDLTRAPKQDPEPPGRGRRKARAAPPGTREYPWDSISFVLPQPAAGRTTFEVVDPYNGKPMFILDEPGYPVRKLERSRYEMLVDDLLDQTDVSIEKTLSIREGRDVVDALDRIWRALQLVPSTKTKRDDLTLDPPPMPQPEDR